MTQKTQNPSISFEARIGQNRLNHGLTFGTNDLNTVKDKFT